MPAPNTNGEAKASPPVSVIIRPIKTNAPAPVDAIAAIKTADATMTANPTAPFKVPDIKFAIPLNTLPARLLVASVFVWPSSPAL